MRRQYRNIWLFLLCAIVAQLVWVAGSALAQVKTYTPGAYPAPRTPEYKLDVTAEELLPIARVLVRKPARFQPLEPGYGIEPGQSVLILVSSRFDNRVLEAIKRAIEELGGQLDIMKTYSSPPSKLTGNFGFLEVNEPVPGGSTLSTNLTREYAKALRAAAQVRGAKPYDLVINGSGGPPPVRIGFKWEYIPWDTADKFMFGMAGFPFEVQDLMDRKGYSTLMNARKIHATDPEGTDMTWKWEPNFAGINREEHPDWDLVLAGHLSPIPLLRSPIEADANGIVAGTINHTGTFPRIALTIRKNEIVKVEGGDEYGQRWQKMLEACRGVQFPGFPAPGCGWFEEAATGSDPWRARALDFAETRGAASWERGRAGVIHWGIGAARNLVALPVVEQWFKENKTPSAGGHWHVHTYFTTMDWTLEDGKVLRVIDKGHWTLLDDPEVRQVAAKYGNPDEILREKWIPAVPGINIPGDYMADYARDPAKVTTAQQEELLKKIQAASSHPYKERPGTSVQAAIP
ncbi:MAG: hypothetical protein HYX73_02165 [Acidobacteria bacterium]|nr:hypothetical protein [Acidobacteriota bacterium]